MNMNIEGVFEQFGLKDVTKEIPIHFTDYISVTGWAYKYDRRFFGVFDGCTINCIIGKERDGKYGAYYNCKGIVYYGGRCESFSYEEERYDIIPSLITQTIYTIIRKLKSLKYLSEPEYIRAGRGIVARIKEEDTVLGE